MTPEELARFDAASAHPYECRCAICLEWWAQVPPEDEEPPDDEIFCACDNDPTEEEMADNACDSCGKPLA